MYWSKRDRQNIVSLEIHQENLKFPVLRQIESYWQALRAGRLLPLRSEIDPRGIEQALENAFILERIAPGLARFRLAGMHLNDVMGMEVRGMPFTSLFAPQARAAVSNIIEQVFQGPEICQLRLQGEGGIGRPALRAGLILLPLKSDTGEISRILGCLSSSGGIGRVPRRFEIAAVTRHGLLRPGEKAAADYCPATGKSREPAGFAEPISEFAHGGKKRPDAKRPALRLVSRNG